MSDTKTQHVVRYRVGKFLTLRGWQVPPERVRSWICTQCAAGYRHKPARCEHCGGVNVFEGCEFEGK